VVAVTHSVVAQVMPRVVARATLKAAAQVMPKVVAQAMPRVVALAAESNSESKREPRWKQRGFFCGLTQANKPKQKESQGS